jgi:transposase InsO family protein
MSGLTPRGALRIGDRVRFDGSVHQVVGIEGTMLRLLAEDGLPWLAAAGHLMAAADFEIMGRDGSERVIPPVALLGAVPEPVAERARFWETHILEVLTGLPGGAPEGAVPRPDFDPRLRGLAEREAAKAAELAAAGEPGSGRNLRRLRQQYERQGLWGLVDHRATRLSREFGRVDERVVEAAAEAMEEQTDDSTGTRKRAWRRAQEILADRYPGEEVPLPSRASVYRLFAALEGGRHTFGSAVRRRSNANRPATPFTATTAQRPGEVVQTDTTPLDVMAVFDDGVLGRPELTITLDVATRTIGSAVLRPAGTKAVDAAVLLARMLVPEPMRPGWDPALSMARSVLPHQRLVTVDRRLAAAAAKPVIVPSTIVIDHGKVFVSETFMTACRVLGISVQPARPYTPTDKGIVERTFRSVNTLFCQYVAGYTGSDVTRRGRDVAGRAAWTLPQLQELLDEWIVAGWQSRPHDGLRSPYIPGRELSPNEAYAVMVARAGYLPVPLSGEDYVELLPVTWRAVNDYGIQIDYRTYDCAELGACRRRSSAAAARNGRWEVHYDPYDLSRVWLRDPDREGWITVPWTQLPMVSAPFADFTWRHAREILAARGQDSTDQTAVARVLDSLLARAGNGPSGRVAGRTAAAVSVARLPGLPGTAPDAGDGQGDGEPEPEDDAPVEPFGVFDPLNGDSGLW